MSGSRRDAVIVGGGPAGATAAILLADAGLRVTLVEKRPFPREKLCGEFVSPEAVRILGAAGVMPALHPVCARAEAFLLTDLRGRSVRLPIPLPAGNGSEGALGIPRREMDMALLERAGRSGAEILQPFEVRRVLTTEGHLTGVAGLERGTGSERVLEAPIVIAADGRDSPLSRLLAPGDFRGRSSPRFGIKAHFEKLAGFSGAVELHYFRGGYVGMHGVGGGKVNVCALIDRSLTGELPRDPEAIVQRIFMTNPIARARLEGAERVSDWLAVASLFFQSERPVRAGAFFLGDAAGTIDPFAGEGLSMAFRSAEIAVEEILRESGSAGATRYGGARARARYAGRWRREFAGRIAFCRLLGRLAVRPSFQASALAVLQRFPLAGRALARGTRAGVRASA